METPIKMLVVQFASTELALAAVDSLEAMGLYASGVFHRIRSCSIRFEFADIDSVLRTLVALQTVLGLPQEHDDE